jgi:hypothetical protein
MKARICKLGYLTRDHPASQKIEPILMCRCFLNPCVQFLPLSSCFDANFHMKKTISTTFYPNAFERNIIYILTKSHRFRCLHNLESDFSGGSALDLCMVSIHHRGNVSQSWHDDPSNLGTTKGKRSRTDNSSKPPLAIRDYYMTRWHPMCKNYADDDSCLSFLEKVLK